MKRYVIASLWIATTSAVLANATPCAVTDLQSKAPKDTTILAARLPPGAWLIDPLPPVSVFGHPLLGVDAFSGLMMPIAALVAFSVVAGGPRRDVDTARLSIILLTEAATLGMLASTDLVLLVAFSIGMLLPAYSFMRATRRGAATRRGGV